MRAKVGDFFRDKYSVGVPFVESRARTDFNAARDYAISLIEIHDTLSGAKAGRPPVQLEALKRSSLILAVTAWESFVEDTVQQQLEEKLAACSSSPTPIQSIFNAVANEWLSPDGPKRQGVHLITWTADGWKQLIRDSLRLKLEKFHTPNTENVDALFKKYLQCASISGQWSWQSVPSLKATRQLDALIKLRGRAVHRGMTLHPMSKPEASMKRATVVSALNLIYNLVDSTEKALGVGPKHMPTAPPNP